MTIRIVCDIIIIEREVMRMNIGIINWHLELKWYWNILMNLFLPIWYNKNRKELNIFLIPIIIIVIIIIRVLTN